MKRFKKLIVRAIALVMICTAIFSFTACADVKKVELKLALYNYTDKVMYAEEEVTMTIDLYRHLAPETVDAIIAYINDGYYNDAVFYKMSGYSTQIMVGDLKMVDGELKQFTKPAIEGEFEKGGTTGSNLLNARGSIGLWRTWNAYDNSYSTSSNTDTGRATWFMPTEEISSYNDWFCVFAQIDLENSVNSTALDALVSAFSSSANYEEYVIYYTGEYDKEKVDENYGLTYNCTLKEDFIEDDVDDLFVAEGEELVCFNKYTVQVPKTSEGELGAKIISAKVK